MLSQFIIHNYEFNTLRRPDSPPMNPADPPLAHRALYEQVADRLRQRILARELELFEALRGQVAVEAQAEQIKTKYLSYFKV